MQITEELAKRVLDTFGQRENRNQDDEQAQVSPVLSYFKSALSEASWSNEAVRTQSLRRLAVAGLGTFKTLRKRKFAAELCEETITSLVLKVYKAAVDLLPEECREELQEHVDNYNSEVTAARVDDKLWEMLYYLGRLKLDAEQAIEDSSDLPLQQYAAAHDAAKRARALIEGVTDLPRWLYLAESAAEAAEIAASNAIGVAKAAVLIPTGKFRVANPSEWAEASISPGPPMVEEKDVDPAADRLLSEFCEAVVQILVEMETPGSKFLYLTE